MGAATIDYDFILECRLIILDFIFVRVTTQSEAGFHEASNECVPSLFAVFVHLLE